MKDTKKNDTEVKATSAKKTAKKSTTTKKTTKKVAETPEVAEVAEEQPIECVAHDTHPLILKGRRVNVTDTRIVLKKGDKYYTLDGEIYDNPSAVITERKKK